MSLPGPSGMTSKRQYRAIELQRRIKIAVDALQSVERYLARELEPEAGSRPDELAERIRDATKAAISRSKDH